MQLKHHGFSRVLGLWLSRNPDFAFKVPFKPLLFHIVRGQHMMPNVIRAGTNMLRCPVTSFAQPDCFDSLLQVNGFRPSHYFRPAVSQ